MKTTQIFERENHANFRQPNAIKKLRGNPPCKILKFFKITLAEVRCFNVLIFKITKCGFEK